MFNYRKCLKCVLVVILSCASLANAANVLSAKPENVEFGTFNTFQIMETNVKLTNKGKETFVIDNIKAECSCIKVSFSEEEISPNQTVELTVYAREVSGGKFSHDILILPIDTNLFEPLKIEVTGNVNEPVSAEVGWSKENMKKFDPNKSLELEPVHKLFVKPVIAITSNDTKFNLEKVVPDVNSTSFELDNYKIDKSSASDKLVLTLKPKDAMKSDLLQQYITVKLKDDVQLVIPFKSRIVGDAYCNEQRISFGSLADSTSRELKIHFINDIKPWQDMKWSVDGSLSSVVDVSIDRSKNTGSFIVADVVIDTTKVAQVPKGYNFSRLRFYENEPTDDNTVSILIDGFN